jgi:myo-inositol-1(or 4)-monophosphatase
LDGTTNYAHGLPIYCASLGLEIDGHTAVGAVYDASREELYTAVRGGGARLNGQPLAVSDTSTLIDALLVTGFPTTCTRRRETSCPSSASSSAAPAPFAVSDPRALDLCYVAAGRFEAFWEQHLKPWDVSAGALIVAEAGGRVTGMDGSAFDPRPPISSLRMAPFTTRC